jgi:hypothetical protein
MTSNRHAKFKRALLREVCERLLAETAESEALRDSCPVFTVLPQELRMRLARGDSFDEAV